MASFDAEALGAVVRELREHHGLTQEELGRRAGYLTGAGVSISRLESGLMRPGAERFAGIARELGLTPEELEALATERTSKSASGSAAIPTAGATADGSSSGGSARGPESVKARARRIQREIDARASVINDLGSAFNAQHDRARDEFFLPFVEIAGRIEGAEQPDPTPFENDDATDPEAVAEFRLQSNTNGVVQILAGGAGGAAAGAAVGSAAAYGTFVAVASFGTASTGTAIAGLSGVAATNATLAVLGGGTLAAGGAGVAGGTILLAGIVAAPALIIGAGGLLWMAKRNRRQQQELAAKLDLAEAELAATRPGVDALEAILPRATEALDYIATHAGHALRRWADRLGGGSTEWASLDPADQHRYQDFIEIAGAQLTVVTINVEGLLTTSDDERGTLIELADELLMKSRNTVETLV